jgi:crotonobetainyl-CoA:carnitine CoA-transferase CaiB-like acyl-CoA transferase
MARILDLAGQAGVYATRLLAEQGHDVVRIESPRGDAIRRLGPFLDGVPDIDDGAYHQFFNAGKRSLAIDIMAAEGREIFERLIKTSDVIVASDPLPLTAVEIHALNPSLVVTILTEDDRPELCAYARSGLLSITGHPGNMPVLMGGHIVYAATGLWVMVATAAAMLVQTMTGKGQIVTVDIQQCFESFLDHAVENYTARGRSTERRGHRGSVTPVSGAFPSSDGFWMLSLSDSTERWRTLMDWMKDPVLADDATLLNYDERLARRDMILDRVGSWSATFPKLELVTEAQRRHIPSAPVSTSLELADDEQLIARGFLVKMDHPVHGPLLFPRGALATIWDRQMTFAPRLGASNVDVLTDLGYSAEEQVALFERGIT